MCIEKNEEKLVPPGFEIFKSHNILHIYLITGTKVLLDLQKVIPMEVWAEKFLGITFLTCKNISYLDDFHRGPQWECFFLYLQSSGISPSEYLLSDLAKEDSLSGNTWTCGPRLPGRLDDFVLHTSMDFHTSSGYSHHWYHMDTNPTLTSAKMGIDAHVTSCTSKALMFSIWNVLPCFRIDVLFGKSKIWNKGSNN